ncbi:ATP/GTP-binding protein [Actinomyces howellii]|nr:ATP/GTP-binding protein [Actinomyces howellii]
MRSLAARMLAGPEQAAVPRGPGSGAVSAWPRMEPWRGTSVQVCGLWPLIVGGAPPVVGAPLGPVLDGEGFVCADHISWFETGLISAPSAMVLALNGVGKSSLVRRIVAAHADMGIHSMVLGDIKPDYVDLIRALGGQVITIGHGQGGINPLDAGNVGQAAAALATDPARRSALLKAAHERKKNMVLSLIQIMRRQPPGNREEIVIDEAVRILEDRGGQPALPDLLQVLREAPEQLRSVALDRGELSRYREVTEELEVSLMALLRGRMGAIFAARETTPMLMDRDVVFDVHDLMHEHSDIQAAVLLSCWSYGFATVEISQALADAGVAPRRRYSLVMDELWRILQASSGMVERVDSLTRLNRTIGIGQMMITHSMADFSSLSSQEDRTKAAGFVERSKMLLLGALPAKEMPLLEGVMDFSEAEKNRLISWSAQGGYDPFSQEALPPAGMGRFLLKTSGAPGVSFRVDFAPAERRLSDTNRRWEAKQKELREQRP